MSTLLFASYGCGNRYYFSEGETAPETCPHDGCGAPKSGVYEDAEQKRVDALSRRRGDRDGATARRRPGR